ncbi:methyl-accepting chemotaxis protein [Poseidonibacter ostreae]|uniref:HAMP domain-containing protein n=1 Tax=Poseidonibacter ostreae TaxID=2654171 RepID=A0ABQ6VJZ2_9BACT|nr:cache domain-containing protein [Poseidonibacter ostreae]KAB7886290.1 HAMP domain-containing protein [Poseidonibacter ostreae]KAB7890046.1 HAMP domain-containing protein [Poseidonibacter ostreae]
MFVNISIKVKLLILALVTIILVSLSIAIQSIYSINKFSHENVDKYKKDSYAKKEEELKNYISLAMKTVEAYHKRTAIDKIKIEIQDDLKTQTNFLFSILEGEYNKLKDILSEDALKFRLKTIVEESRYGKSGYFWINDTDAVIVMHPIKPQLNGKDLVNYKDKGGKKIFKEFAAVAKAKGEGFVDYVWPKPGFETPQPKVSFVKLFKEYNWVIGTGEYVADVSSKIKEEALNTISKMRYGKDGYFWINDSYPKMIMHSVKPSLDGKDLSKVQDKAGKYLFKEFSVVANKEAKGGLVKYMWPKPNFDAPQQKFSYVQRFPHWDWIIGTGVYVDDIEADISLMRKQTSDEIEDIITSIVIFSLIAILLVYIIYSFLITRTIIKPLSNLSDTISDMNNADSEIKEIEKRSNDEVGKLVDSFNAYIRKLKEGVESDAKVIEEVDEVISKVNNGFYVYKIEKNSVNPQIQELKNSINSMIDKTNENLSILNNTLLRYGSSDFTVDKNTSSSEVSGIISSINSSTRLIGVTVSEFLSMIVSSGKKLNEDTNILSSSANSLSSSANEQAASLEETAAALEEVTCIVKSNVQKVQEMSSLASDLQSSSSEGEALASKTTQAMDDIDKQVNSINDAITVIDQIAFQTNILSLNAAVEAATAGEAGKGFAVVAQEVRNLANRSAEAAKEIKGIVETATSKANEGKLIANDMIGGYSKLNDNINKTIELIEDVSTASVEEESGIVQINDAINSLDQATQLNASSATTISNLANEVSDLSENLLKIADRAKFNESSGNEIADIDLVFKVSKLKNDHIKFKNTNFEKIGTTINPWAVTKPTECDLGKWIIEQEQSGKEFTRNTNWKDLKQNHEDVHNNVQSYINETCKENADNSTLNQFSGDLDKATLEVFKALDQIKRDNVIPIKKVVQVQTEEIARRPSIKNENEVSKRDTSKNVESRREVTSPVPSKTATNKIIEAKPSKDDDEWESF